MRLFLISIFLVSVNASVFARPVSYPGGWTIMQMNSAAAHSLHVHYTPDPHYSVGVRNEYERQGEYMLNALQTNILMKRWNKKDSQANLYFKGGVGIASKRQGENADNGAIFAGMSADWETRRWFASYENRSLMAGSIDQKFEQKARIGVAPYIAGFGGLHTWVMVEAHHDPKAAEEITLTPLVRLFKGPVMIEAGLSDENDVLFNFIYRF